MNNPASHTSSQLTDRDRANLSKLIDYTSIRSIPEIWAIVKQKFGQTVALHDPHSQPEIKLTYTDLYQQIQQFAAGLQALGIEPDPGEAVPPRVALFADNSPRWLIADQGIMMAGAANAVRGATADPEELLYIIQDSGSTALVVENRALLKKLQHRLPDLPIQLIVLLSDEEPEASPTLNTVKFSQVMTTGANRPLKPSNHKPQTLATLLYTSGTTGKPKGVMLTHGNLLHQVTTFGTILQPEIGESALSILPSWHAYERTVEYFLLSQGCTQIYTSIRYFKQDFKAYKPQYMISVPRIWESIYEAVQKQFREQPANKQKLVNFLLSASQQYIENRRIFQGLTLSLKPASASEKLIARIKSILLWPVHALAEKLVYQKVREATGGRFKWAISGGGSLATHLDNFFEIANIGLLVGYGLTETSPVLTVRRPWHNLKGSAGQPIAQTEIKIVDPETRQQLPAGQRGLVLARGPQIMQGYYLNPQATAKVIDPEGWFDTGDLGWLTPGNDLILTGRAKDTIVLSNGENIEPQPIEDACVRSPYIDQIMLVGQDQKSVGALIVPNAEAVQKWAETQNPPLHEIDWNSKTIQDLFRKELNREVQNRPGYRADDRIGPFRLIQEPFSIENGMLTQTLKIKRPVVTQHYRDMIDGMF
ncbi:Long-chain-fatty-acid--CoA ligase [Oscillatoria nigro-viridis PCC 7112]|uniref:Long-chain-fatty-acid--CoA ligase n=1 Tax=Phormidium nigroviride PCC 7112 TaxID=179408 RepID=K9VQP4_9CYAN|nr:long-chain fatty acid--CoA ligase [Oscillatoria nigro-viridis]AFZ10266.1 Long-chain-fatty-acid--CoA ligase [Oscillatoria nigro-viridis PCC 7112]